VFYPLLVNLLNKLIISTKNSVHQEITACRQLWFRFMHQMAPSVSHNLIFQMQLPGYISRNHKTIPMVTIITFNTYGHYNIQFFYYAPVIYNHFKISPEKNKV